MESNIALIAGAGLDCSLNALNIDNEGSKPSPKYGFWANMKEILNPKMSKLNKNAYLSRQSKFL
jgi:hypothetical protein